MSDLIDRQAAIDAVCDNCNHVQAVCPHYPCKQYLAVEKIPSAYVVEVKDIEAECELAYKHGWSDCFAEHRWIPVTERLPGNTYPVNITWVNHKPVSYYANIKDKPFTATGCFCDGKWYWYSATCQDYLDEYRYCDVDSMDNEIEVIAWMPLPEPYRPKGGEADV